MIFLTTFLTGGGSGFVTCLTVLLTVLGTDGLDGLDGLVVLGLLGVVGELPLDPLGLLGAEPCELGALPAPDEPPLCEAPPVVPRAPLPL